jgi:tetratricopeptide (TPR) repeat protein
MKRKLLAISVGLVLGAGAPLTAQQNLEENLRRAEAVYARDTTNADAIIWLGRRHAYLGQYREAIEAFTKGIALHPRDARFYRHRGHRYITLRRFKEAIADLAKAAELVRGQPDEIEPDGAPNAHNIPISTLQSNIWYHLALAHYLEHDFEQALRGWEQAMRVSANDDMKVATADWLYMTLRRLGRAQDAAQVLVPITRDMRILENHAYHKRLLMYKGELRPEELLSEQTEDAVQLATFGYGVANWYFYNGEREKAYTLFRRIVAGKNPAAFGHIAAEVELAKSK